ncbi:sec-independent translocase [Streptomyces sp. NBC_01387]|uniref:sec-independent translocase n=1 Tax=unclassified Streptomyces TaxID=2593676 RepID=UPI00202509CA|nr:MULTISPECIES: sec-independent translocase [unclassified Streptomyces]MCX4553977.1 sec-independent translocase [Streptomyces sp. NBC_01500]WSC18882.1 sec-independent translocase [Streptomyces sp. NBC_01766]WSV52917.1 sec-independent translocase [Streptomyces sp. NBC_01014]
MFSDVGPLEVMTLAALAVLLFGPDKLPEVIQKTADFLRKIRAFSEEAKREVRSGLGPEFEDFEFEDLHPKTFVRKQLMGGDGLGIDEIRSAFDLRREAADVADAVRQVSVEGEAGDPGSGGGSSARVDLRKSGDATVPAERGAFDSEAT